MICYLIRHGKDDETVRGGWSSHGLVPEGIEQVKALGAEMGKNQLEIGKIYSSDLQRAKETALLLQDALHCPVEFLTEFREADNGYLAGMKHDVANEMYPGIYWSVLDYTECYPGGESPKQFFERIQTAWAALKQRILNEEGENVVLVTHGGVLEAVLCMENGIQFTNKERHFRTPEAKLFPVEVL